MLRSQFEEAFQYTLSQAPVVDTCNGAMDLVEDVIADGNELVVMSSLPRALAVKLIERARLVDLFQGRVSADRLVSLLDQPDAQSGPLTMNQHIMRSCCLMEKNGFNTVYIGANNRNVLAAKRLGLNAVAVRGQ
jgi:phosphoglycolate phosphatase-like HAD superfamily hydrolase